MSKNGFISLAFLFVIGLIFALLFVSGKFPIPSDSLVGLYHPFRDLYVSEYPNGIPFKNFLITDPIRQQYPWRFLAISELRDFTLPLWNPYAFSGSPLLATIQSAALYPLNVVFLFIPFSYAWSLLVLLQPILMGMFMYLYLSNIRLSRLASLFGGISFALSGFSVSWMEWNTIGHTALWLPLLLLSIEKLLKLSKVEGSKLYANSKNHVLWSLVFVFSLSTSLFAGHLQTFFYLSIFSAIYFLIRWVQLGRDNFMFIRFVVLTFLSFLITAVQWIPTLQFISHSARDIDTSAWQREGWFLPWEHLIQFIAPDFFGNPTTLNYWGVWNYGELVGYIGLVPLLMAFFALCFVRSKKVLFFGLVLFISLLFSLPTPFAKIPFLLDIPFLSTAQPTRLLFLIDFSLVILAAIGINEFQEKRKKFFVPLFLGILGLSGLWIAVGLQGDPLHIGNENLAVARRNLILPTLIMSVVFVGYFLALTANKKRFTILILFLFVSLTLFDLSRFAQKFLPFSPQSYLYPKTSTINFLQDRDGNFRIMATDSRIMPPNVSMMYKIQTVDGYDPLYLRRYAELIAASERGEPNITPPFGFNRIITPQNYDSQMMDLLGVEYVLSLKDIDAESFTKVFQEGETRVYQNREAFPRAFFVETIVLSDGKQETIDVMFDDSTDLRTTAVIEYERGTTSLARDTFSVGHVAIEEYGANRVILYTENEGEGFLVFMDSYYPTWRARVDGKEWSITRTNYNFRGIVVPEGEHTVEFYNTLF